MTDSNQYYIIQYIEALTNFFFSSDKTFIFAVEIVKLDYLELKKKQP